MKIEICFACHRTSDTSPSFFIQFDNGSYIFNVPDETQRVFMDHRWKVSKIKAAFMTSLDENSTGGFLGMIFTMLSSENFVVPKLIGPKGLKEQLLCDFAYKDTPEYLPEISDFYSDENLTVKTIELTETIAFDIQLRSYPGKFLPDKAKKLGVPPGPLFRKLANGESITLDNGTVVNSSDCMTDSLPGDNFLVIDARSLNDLKLIKDLTKYNYVIHFTNNDLLTNPEYVDFFSKVKTNFAFNTNNSVSYQQVYNIYQECAKLHPDFLAPLTSSSKSEEIPSIYTVIFQSDVYRLAPLDKKKLEFAPKTQENEVEGEYPKFETFGVTFLGTGARQPSSMRNVTGLMLHTKSGVIAIDPGEDYYGQLCRKYGKTVTEQLLKEIKMVFVTHIHGDHTFGVHKLLSERSKLTNEEIIVQADQILIDELKYYEKYQKFYVNYVNRDTTTVTVGNNVVTSIPVNHCPGSHAILVEIDGKYRFSFTGDKNQEDEYVKTVGKCDLLVHEATYDEDKADKAKEVCHSTVKQAIAVGKELGAKTCLTHISGRYSCGISESEKGSFFMFDYLFIPYERVDEVEAVCKDMIDLMNKSEDN